MCGVLIDILLVHPWYEPSVLRYFVAGSRRDKHADPAAVNAFNRLLEEKVAQSLPPVRRHCSSCTLGVPYADYPVLHFIEFNSNGEMKLTFDPQYRADVDAAVREANVGAILLRPGAAAPIGSEGVECMLVNSRTVTHE